MTMYSIRRQLSILLAGAILFSFLLPGIPARAAEITQDAPLAEETVVTEAPTAETTAPTLAVSAASETVMETTAPTVEASISAETAIETTAPTVEATSATEAPEETVPPPIPETTAPTELPAAEPAGTEAPSEPAETLSEYLPEDIAGFETEYMDMALFSLAPEPDTFQRIDSLNQLVSGEYVLVAEGYALDALNAENWITSLEPTLENDTVTDAFGAVWTLEVGSGVTLTDPNGNAIAPANDDQNGLRPAEYVWQVTCEGGAFSFHGRNAVEPVTLAGNPAMGNWFRAYRDTTVYGKDPYPYQFTLYRKTGGEEAPIPLLTIADAKAIAEGTEGVRVQGTVVYLLGDRVILQDETGGISLTFDTPPALVLGDTLLVTGRRTGGLAAAMYEKTGAAECPAKETALGSIGPEQDCTRILVKNVVIGSGEVTQEGLSLPAVLPEDAIPRKRADVSGVLIDGTLYAQTVTLLPDPEPEPAELWSAVELANIQPTDVVAITMTKDGQTWAVGSTGGSQSAPAFVEVLVEEGRMQSGGEGIGWNIEQTGEGLILHPAGEDSYLFCATKAKIYVATPDSNYWQSASKYWQIDSNYLRYVDTGCYLFAREGWRTTDLLRGTAANQVLQFWRQEVPEPEAVAPVAMSPESGELASGQGVTLSCATEGADLYFATSLDGVTYTEFAPYTGEIVMPEEAESLYIKAYGEKSGFQASAETLGAYTRKAPPETAAPVTATPGSGEIQPGQAIALSCATEGASVYFATSPDGVTYTGFAPYTGEIPTAAGFASLYIKAYAEKAGCTSSGETTFVYTEKQANPPAPGPDLGWNLYFGQLHAHTELSDGLGSVEEAFLHAAEVEGLDFFAVTDHSNSFDNANSGGIALDGTAISQKWAAGKAAAAAVTGEDFVGIFGYEMTWQEGRHLGHINTFSTPGWQSRDQAEFASLEPYYQALTTVPDSVSQFNHPGEGYGDFEAFSHYRADYDRQITLLELGDEGSFDAYASYIQALDAGWHVAPTCNQNNHNGSWGDASAARTVALAPSLTEQALYDAMRSHRVYATQDSDLILCYRLNGHIMGSIIGGGGAPEISVYLQDPTDGDVGTVAVIADGGAVVAEQRVDSPQAQLTLAVPGGYSYYFLRVTQPDGDLAVTAPVWVDHYEDMGIQSLTADAVLPIQGREVGFTLTLYNQETVDFSLDTIRFSVGGQIVHALEAPGTVKALDTFTCAFPYTHSGLGVTDITAEVIGRANGETRTYTKTLRLSYQAPEMVSGILVDGSHGNYGLDALGNLAAIAARGSMEVTTFTDSLPEGGDLLLISAPEIPFEEAFLDQVSNFVEKGGSLIVCGRGDTVDSGGTAELNRLLDTLGATLRLNDDTAVDDIHNGGSRETLYPAAFNLDAKWTAGVTQEQFYGHRQGCTVDPGNGTWLVQGFVTTHSYDADGDGLSSGGNILLACEEMPGGGTIFAAGCLFLSDGEMPAQKNLWDPPRANQTILENLLDVEQVTLPLRTIRDLRSGELGQVYRIQGYVTAGTSNPYNTFPDTIYLQDTTGGIAVIPFTESGIQLGTPMEITGFLESQDGNLVLAPIRYRVLEEDYYNYVPKTMYHSAAMNYEKHGGELLQVQGTVVSLTYTPGGRGISRFTVRDIRGDLATVSIESTIFSGATGVNALSSQVRKGRTVRAMGLLHLDSDGAPVLRVRNCDEVVHIPPAPDPSNPKTGDGLPRIFALLPKWMTQKP